MFWKNLFAQLSGNRRGASTQSLELPNLCYKIAYFVLPQHLYSDTERTIAVWDRADMPPGPFFYFIACKQNQKEPTRDVAFTFHHHQGQLANGKKYYILQYPTPPLVSNDLSNMVLAPYFSAIVLGEDPENLNYYILGQRPLGGTTLRTVTRDGVNANLGEGPSPTLEAFVDRLGQDGKSEARAA